ncbi:hypothetical protein P4604_18170 [Lysinibacillus capsici]|uniref:hypothetical protein n=1 Tax=Lysinibacillus capsici TaxID=2115968 RepID=UPI002E200951|nr:hypothetical protein [Lysinibacillus capsici]
MKKILVSTLLLGTLSTAVFADNKAEASAVTDTSSITTNFSQVASPVAANAEPVIWCHPSRAKEIGRTFSTDATITRDELIKINTYFDNKETGQSVQAGLATTILTAPLNGYFSVSAGVAVTFLTSYVDTQGKMVNSTLLKSTKSKFNVKITYNYLQTGSNDGYYSISKIKITEK